MTVSNRLQYETSPYLLQHKDNPVDWYPWGNEAFERARAEDKPIFLSIGYSTCHWCHVLAHESFEDREIADLLNRYFIPIKVDKEERPDIDSVYMAVCQAFTGSGGWPTSIFMTAEQKPFFAGTYFPKTARGGMIGMRELLLAIHEKWEQDRQTLLKQADEILKHLNSTDGTSGTAEDELTHTAVELYKRRYDAKHGGFGRAPKFPAPHNLLFLLSYYERYNDQDCLHMAEHTLLQMYRGGLFDHIGFGFCRYSTDKAFLVPHFEKMLYDNALLILAYCKAYANTKKPLYLEIAEKTAAYILRDMTSEEGAFYSAQDADSQGEEGKFYLFTPTELRQVLGEEDGNRFNRHFDICDKGNFEGMSIPNLLQSDVTDTTLDALLPLVREYRQMRFPLGLDDKILTSWNSLMIAAMCELYLVSKKPLYLQAAQRADAFIQKYLYADGTLFVSYRDGKRGTTGFLDDYAGYMLAQLCLYKATFDSVYAERTEQIFDKVAAEFGDHTGGFYLYSRDSEALILRPKETYDGAMPSGNSLMAYNLVWMAMITDSPKYRKAAEQQLEFLVAEASAYPIGYAMFLTAFLHVVEPPTKIIIVSDADADTQELPLAVPTDAVAVLRAPSQEYPLKNDQTTYYVCTRHSCLPPTNDLHKHMEKHTH